MNTLVWFGLAASTMHACAEVESSPPMAATGGFGPSGTAPFRPPFAFAGVQGHGASGGPPALGGRSPDVVGAAGAESELGGAGVSSSAGGTGNAGEGSDGGNDSTSAGAAGLGGALPETCDDSAVGAEGGSGGVAEDPWSATCDEVIAAQCPLTIEQLGDAARGYGPEAFTYTATVLGSGVTPIAINDHGLIVGYATLCGAPRAFLYERGVLRALPTLGGGASVVDINERGVIVGNSASGAVMWKNGRVERLVCGLEAVALNDSEQVLLRRRSGAVTRGYLWENGTLTDLGRLPGASSTEPIAMDALGRVVGVSGDRNFSWEAGVMTPLLHGPGIPVIAINDRGYLLGRSALWDGSRRIDLTALAPVQESVSASGLNEAGAAVGSYWVGDDRRDNSVDSPFVYERGAFHPITAFVGAEYSEYGTAAAINGVGEIVGLVPVGSSSLYTGSRAVVWSKQCFDTCCP